MFLMTLIALEEEENRKTIDVEGPSMAPTLTPGQKVRARLGAYDSAEPERQDIALCLPPGVSEPCVKRIIGMPGERVEILAGQVYIDGAPLDEPYLSPPARGSRIPRFKARLKERQYLVLGDYRALSVDSRFFGPLSREALIGSVEPDVQTRTAD